MDQVDILERNLDRQLQWVRAAESRLALVLSLATAMLGALAVSIPRAFEWSATSAVAASFAVFFFVISIAFSALACFPRTSGPRGSLVYFKGIESLESSQFVESMKSLTTEAYIDDLAKQCHRNAQIAAKKYGWVQKSMASLFLAALPWAVALFTLYVRQ